MVRTGWVQLSSMPPTIASTRAVHPRPHEAWASSSTIYLNKILRSVDHCFFVSANLKQNASIPEFLLSKASLLSRENNTQIPQQFLSFGAPRALFAQFAIPISRFFVVARTAGYLINPINALHTIQCAECSINIVTQDTHEVCHPLLSCSRLLQEKSATKQIR